MFDCIVIGAGAAGMMCAIQAGKRGRKVALLELSDKPGTKILVSGGGRCNFTNLDSGPEKFVSQNPHFCKSALSRYKPAAFIQMVEEHSIGYHEKKLGQLFCDNSAQDIVSMLADECQKANVKSIFNCKVSKIKKDRDFSLGTNQGSFSCPKVVIATGGLSIPKLGATDFGYRIAKQFGLKIVDTMPALDGFRFGPQDSRKYQGLMGVSADVRLTCQGASFRENILFTHVGLSGPAALQASLFWNSGSPVEINFSPQFEGSELLEWIKNKKIIGSKLLVKTVLATLLPKRLADRLGEILLPPRILMSQISDKAMEQFCADLQHHIIVPASTVGYKKAEVTRGGVDTDELSSKTMESAKSSGLYFIGEVVDVTGWLGGYNFQWAWSSGFVAGQAL